MTFLNDLTFYSWQIISHLKEHIHVPFCILIEFPVNRKCATIHTFFFHIPRRMQTAHLERAVLDLSRNP